MSESISQFPGSASLPTIVAIWLTTLVLVTVTAGCGTSAGKVPTESDAKQAVSIRLLELSSELTSEGNMFEIVSFKKINGQHSVKNGVKCYKLDYAGVVKTTGMGNLSVEMGMLRNVSGSVKYEMTENGWRQEGPIELHVP